MKVLVNREKQTIEINPDTLFFVPFPKEVEEHHKKSLLEVLKINLGIDPNCYHVIAQKARIFVVPKKAN